MDTSRRDLLALGSAFMALGASSAHAAPGKAPPGFMQVLHVYAGADGLSRAQRIRIHGAKPLPTVQVLAGTVGKGDSDWGTAPQKRFSVVTQGSLDVKLGDGTWHHIAKGDLVFIDDQGTSGHLSHFIEDVANLFLVVPDDFDLQSWAGAPDAA